MRDELRLIKLAGLTDYLYTTRGLIVGIGT